MAPHAAVRALPGACLVLAPPRRGRKRMMPPRGPVLQTTCTLMLLRQQSCVKYDVFKRYNSFVKKLSNVVGGLGRASAFRYQPGIPVQQSDT